MALDPVSNFGIANILGQVTATGLTIELYNGDMPNMPSGGSYNCVLYNSSDYVNPNDDPYVEIVRATFLSGNYLTVARGQEKTVASNHNITGKQYSLVNTVTAKMITDINTAIYSGSLISVSGGTILGNLVVVNSLEIPYTPNSSGASNSFAGSGAGINNTSGYGNTFFGSQAGNQTTIGPYNTAVGQNALFSNVGGEENTAVGENALYYNDGSYNTAVGLGASENNNSGYQNTAIGMNALFFNQNGYNNIGLGFQAYTQGISDSNEIVIGTSLSGNGSNTVTIGNSSNTANYFTGPIYSNGQKIVVSGIGLGTVTTSTANGVITISGSNAAGNFVAISGANMTGTLNAPVISGTVISGGTIYSKDYWATLPAFAFLSSSGVTTNLTSSSVWTVISGSSFNTVSGANFLITASNPASITYTGPQSMYGKIDLSASVTATAAASTYSIGISLNGVTAISGVNIYTQATNALANITTASLSTHGILPLVSGNTIQAVILDSAGNTANVSTLQLSITKIL